MLGYESVVIEIRGRIATLWEYGERRVSLVCRSIRFYLVMILGIEFEGWVFGR